MITGKNGEREKGRLIVSETRGGDEGNVGQGKGVEPSIDRDGGGGVVTRNMTYLQSILMQ